MGCEGRDAQVFRRNHPLPDAGARLPVLRSAGCLMDRCSSVGGRAADLVRNVAFKGITFDGGSVPPTITTDVARGKADTSANLA